MVSFQLDFWLWANVFKHGPSAVCVYRISAVLNRACLFLTVWVTEGKQCMDKSIPYTSPHLHNRALTTQTQKIVVSNEQMRGSCKALIYYSHPETSKKTISSIAPRPWMSNPLSYPTSSGIGRYHKPHLSLLHHAFLYVNICEEEGA